MNVFDKEYSGDIQLKKIGIISSCFPQKFGIPRQPGIARSSAAAIRFFPPYNTVEMVRGLEEFSHIWVHFFAHQAVVDGWRPTIRPPRLGGRKRCGVFACRSLHRPNHIGLSAVRLERIELQHPDGPKLYLSGIDFLDGTPVLDIKPYVPYSDAISSASEGFTAIADSNNGVELSGNVVFAQEAADFCVGYEAQTQQPLRGLIEEIIGADPRPRSQQGKKDFGMFLWDVNVRWRVENEGAVVISCCLQN